MSESDFALQHEIFILDAHLEKPLDASRQDEITNTLVRKLLVTLGMEPLGPLNIYPALDLRAPGWSFIQPITTSHISGHYFEKPGRDPHIRMDLYSCESVHWEKVIETCHTELQLSDWRASFIMREIEHYQPRKIVDICGKGTTILHQTELNPISATADIVTEKHVYNFVAQ